MAGFREGFFGFGFRVFFYLVFGLVLSDAILYFITDHTIGESYRDAMAVLEMARHTTFTLSVTLNAIVHFGVLAAIFIASLMMSNRISGPMFRFWSVARAVKDGDLTVDVNIRQGDLMKPQAEEFRFAITAMRKKMKNIKDASQRLAGGMEKLERAVSAGADGGAKTEVIAKEMIADVGEIKEVLSFFRN